MRPSSVALCDQLHQRRLDSRGGDLQKYPRLQQQTIARLTNERIGSAEGFGYPELAQLLRRRGVVDGDLYVVHMRELFRRMVFNILSCW